MNEPPKNRREWTAGDWRKSLRGRPRTDTRLMLLPLGNVSMNLNCVCGQDSTFDGEMPRGAKCPGCGATWVFTQPAEIHVQAKPEDGRAWSAVPFIPLVLDD